jgi:hypothetical protein
MNAALTNQYFVMPVDQSADFQPPAKTAQELKK